MSATTVLDSSLGAFEIGVIISTFLFGILTFQVYMYYSQFPEDGVYTKSLVAIVWLLELGNAISISHVLYVMSVTDYGDFIGLVRSPTSLFSAQLFGGFIPPIVQTYFAWRLYRFSNNIYIPAISVTLSLLCFIFGLVSGAIGLKIGVAFSNFAAFVNRCTWILMATGFLRVINDFLITTLMLVHLYKRRANTEFPSTLRVLNKLIKWALESGFLTTLTSIAMLICFLAWRNNIWWLAIWFLISRVFANSYLAALNSRLTLRMMKGDIITIGSAMQHPPGVQTHCPSTNTQIEFARSVITDSSEVRVPAHKNHFKNDGCWPETIGDS